MNMAEAGGALCIPGNHDVKLLRRLRGAAAKLTHGLAITVSQLEQEGPERFVRREPFYRTHECVFAVLALENEAVDPRL